MQISTALTREKEKVRRACLEALIRPHAREDRAEATINDPAPRAKKLGRCCPRALVSRITLSRQDAPFREISHESDLSWVTLRRAFSRRGGGAEVENNGSVATIA